MLTLILVKALALVSFDSPALPWDAITVVYKTSGKSTHAPTPWATESLSHGNLPAIVDKGSL